MKLPLWLVPWPVSREERLEQNVPSCRDHVLCLHGVVSNRFCVQPTQRALLHSMPLWWWGRNAGNSLLEILESILIRLVLELEVGQVCRVLALGVDYGREEVDLFFHPVCKGRLHLSNSGFNRPNLCYEGLDVVLEHFQNESSAFLSSLRGKARPLCSWAVHFQCNG